MTDVYFLTGALGFAACGALIVLAMPWVATQLARRLESIPPLLDPSLLHGAGAIVVLGGDFWGNAPEFGPHGVVGPLTLQRLHLAARLHRRTGVPLLLTGGVIGRGARPLAEAMAEVLAADFGLDARWIERTAMNTMENARNSRAILEREGIDRICLVTHGWHMNRAALAFEREGFRLIPAPTLCSAKPAPLRRDFVPDARSLSRSLHAVREYLALARYRWLARASRASASQAHVPGETRIGGEDASAEPQPTQGVGVKSRTLLS